MKTREQLEQQCAEWNQKFPVGTKVKRYRRMHSKDDPDAQTYTTGSVANILGGHTAVIWLDGYSGCVALDSLEPIALPGEDTAV